MNKSQKNVSKLKLKSKKKIKLMEMKSFAKKAKKRFYLENIEEDQQDQILLSKDDSLEEEEDLLLPMKKKKIRKFQSKKNSVWTDENEENIEVNISSVARLRKLRKNDKETLITGKDYQNRLQEFYNTKLFKTDFFKWGNVEKNEEEEQEEEFSYLNKLINKEQINVLEEKEERGNLPEHIIDIKKIRL